MPQSFQRSRSARSTAGRHTGGPPVEDTGSVAVACATVTIGRLGMAFLISPDTLFGTFSGANEYSKSLNAFPTRDGS